MDIEAVVENTGVKAENTLDLKNPFFHYTGQPSTAPAGLLLQFNIKEIVKYNINIKNKLY